MNNLHNDQRGFAALLALAMVVLMTGIGLYAMRGADDEVTIAGNSQSEAKAFYAAEAELERVAATLQRALDSTGAPPEVMPVGKKTHNGFDVYYITKDDGPAVTQIVTTGVFAGLNSVTKSYSATSIAKKHELATTVQLSESFEVSLVPIFQFAVFYFHDLWAQPYYDLIVDGRVHVNGDMYLQNWTGKLEFQDRVSASGKINHGFGYGSGAGGDVRFADGTGTTQSMLQDGSWLDNTDPDWYTDAAALWNGTVQDEAFGVNKLALPLSNADDDPRALITRGAGNSDSYEHKADLKVIDGVPYASSGGIWVDISAKLPAGTISNSSFEDGHENKTVNSTDIDVAKLQSSGYFPTNGVIYVSDQRGGSNMNGSRVINGSDVGAPLTLATENPLYVQGDFNTVGKQPVSFLSDALTILSNNWDDAKSTDQWDKRSATPTEVNAAFVTGDLAPAGENYGGGLENLPRFLEHWKGTEFKYRGSMIEGWRSKEATGTWRYTSDGDPYYSAPTRNWGYDIMFDDPTKMPPQTPMIRVFSRVGWKQEHVGFASNPDG